MADLQNRAGRTVPEPVVLVAGETLQLKLIPSTGEKLPFQITVAGAGIVTVKKVDNRTGPNFTTFELLGGASGTTRITLTPAKGVARSVAIGVEARITLPAADTDIGLLVRLFLAETDSPGPGIALKDQEKSMRLMRVVVDNRLAKPSGRWASRGATGMGDVVRSPGQFRGFENYPKLSTEMQGNIDDIFRVANTAGDSRRTAMLAYVKAAIAIASGNPPGDPTTTGLYWWRTKNKGSPGGDTVEYESVLDNTFFRAK